MTIATLARLCTETGSTLTASFKPGDCLRVTIDAPDVTGIIKVLDGVRLYGVYCNAPAKVGDEVISTGVIEGMTPHGRLYLTCAEERPAA